MKIEKPIFINGFSRGGTTILTNLLASHPDVCTVGETHHLFKGTTITDGVWRVVRKCLFHELPVFVSQREDFFSPRRVCPRRPLAAWTRRHIDQVFYREKLRSFHPRLNGYKEQDARYSPEELAAGRLVGKNIDGMIYANDAWADMYPDASFFGLVRNGFALCEGHVRRGRPAREIGWRYRVLVEKMLSDGDRLPRYEIFRFEDLVADPWTLMQRACSVAELDRQRLTQFRMQVRRVMDDQGNHRLQGGQEWDVVWLKPSELAGHFLADVNRNQIKRLSPADRDHFLSQAGDVMERLGYSTDLETQQESGPTVLPFSRPDAEVPPGRAASTRRRAA
jgi:hypothetical protein